MLFAYWIWSWVVWTDFIWVLCDDVVVFLSFILIHYHVINVNLCSKLLFVDILRCMHFDYVCFIYYYCMHRVYRQRMSTRTVPIVRYIFVIRYLPRWFDCHWYLWSVEIFFHLSSLPHSLLLIAILRPPDVVLCIFYTSIDEIFKANQKHLIETQDWQQELSDIGDGVDGDDGGDGGMKSKWFSCLWFVVLEKQMHGPWIWKFGDIASTWSLHLFRFFFQSLFILLLFWLCFRQSFQWILFAFLFFRFTEQFCRCCLLFIFCMRCVVFFFIFIFFARVDTAARGIGNAPLSLTWVFNISHSDCIIEWLNKYLEIVISIFASIDKMA